jgi:hypothetical protein
MNFLQVFLRGVALVPSVIQGVESLFGSKTGAQKKDAVVSIAMAAINVTNAVEQKTVLDPASFSQGLGQVIDGVVMCLNASLWHKAQ